MEADNTTSGALVNLLTTGSRMHFVPRSTFGTFANVTGMVNFQQQHLHPQTGSIPSYPVAQRPGSEVFQGTQSTQAGLLRVEVCDHERWRVLLTAQQVFKILSALFNHGWEPLNGARVVRLNLQALRGHPLNHIIHQAFTSGVTEITSVDLNYLFSGYPPFQRGERMHLRLYQNVPETFNGFAIQTIAFQVNSAQTTGHVVGLDRAFQAMFELGGAPDGTAVYPLVDDNVLHLFTLSDCLSNHFHNQVRLQRDR